MAGADDMNTGAATTDNPLAEDVTSATPVEHHATAFRRPGEVVGNYRIRRLLARGGLSEVYLAENQVTETVVVIKVLAARLENRADLQKRLRVEAQSGELLAHPNIVRMRDAGMTSDGRLYLAMDYVPGRTLREQLDLFPDRRIELEGTLHIMIQVVNAIRFAHKNGVLHRDLKPENIMVLPNGDAKIVDFGIAKLMQRGDDSADMPSMGTLRYLSPEQIRNEPVDERADMYALGIILYETFGGKHPFDMMTEIATDAEMTARHLAAQPLALPELFPVEDASVASAVWRVVQKCLAKDPKDRMPSADALLEALCELARTSVLPVHPEIVRISHVLKMARERQTEAANTNQGLGGVQNTPSDETQSPVSEPASRAALMPEAPLMPPPQTPSENDGQRKTEPAVFDPARPVLPFVSQQRPRVGVGQTVKLPRPNIPAAPVANGASTAEARSAFAPAHAELTPTLGGGPPAQGRTKKGTSKEGRPPNPMPVQPRQSSNVSIILLAVASGAALAGLSAVAVWTLRGPGRGRPPIAVAATPGDTAETVSTHTEPVPASPAPPAVEPSASTVGVQAATSATSSIQAAPDGSSSVPFAPASAAIAARTAPTSAPRVKAPSTPSTRTLKRPPAPRLQDVPPVASKQQPPAGNRLFD